MVDEARRTLRQFPIAGRAYLMLKDRVTAAQLTEWTVVDHAGPAADHVLVRLSGKPLSDGISGVYPRAVFDQDVLPRLSDLVAAVQNDAWILSDTADPNALNPSTTLTSDVLALYYDDYIKQWEGLVADISLQPARNVGEASDILNFAAGPTSPLKMIWQAIDHETQLAHAPAAETTAAKPPDPAAQNRLASALSAAGNTQPTYGQPVEDRFHRFHETVAAIGGGPAIIDLFLQDLSELSKDTARLAATSSGGSEPAALIADASDEIYKIETWSERFPPGLADAPKSVARSLNALIKGQTRGDFDRQWDSKVLPFCTQALDGRYPLQKAAAADVTIDDFARLFAPNGLIDAFFNTSLKPFVDMTQDPWKLRNTGDVSVSADSLAEFQRAARIRDMFFGTGTTPVLRFEITPISMDSDSSKSILSIDGQEIAYDGSSPHTISVQWPGPGGERQSTLSFAEIAAPAPAAAAKPATTTQTTTAQTPAPAPAPAPSPVITKTGPWSLFRLLDSGRLQKVGGTDRYRVTFSAAGHSATYEIHAGSVVNPLSSNELAKFKCPSAL